MVYEKRSYPTKAGAFEQWKRGVALAGVERAFPITNNVVLMNSLEIESTWFLKSPLAPLFQRGVIPPFVKGRSGGIYGAGCRDPEERMRRVFSGFRISAARSVLVRNDAVSNKGMKSPKD